MKNALLYAGFGLMVMTGAAFAAGTHSGGHDHENTAQGHDNSDGHHGELSVGVPGKAAEVSRIVKIVMRETEDGDMVFEPAELDVKKDETIRFIVVNEGELDHEFVLDDHEGVMEHKKLMEKFPEMEHDDPNSVHVEPGGRGEVIWKFSNAGSFEFACLIPGHYDAGMKGDIAVSDKVSAN